jgi:hypothetical protein
MIASLCLLSVRRSADQCLAVSCTWVLTWEQVGIDTLERLIKEAQVYLGEGGWSWLACCSLFVHYLSRTSLQLYQLLYDG